MSERDAYTNPSQRGDVSVRIGYPTGSGGKQHAVLTVVDEPSRQTLVEVELTPEMLIEVMGNGTAHATGAVLPVRPDRIGMRAQNTSITVPTPARPMSPPCSTRWRSCRPPGGSSARSAPMAA